MPTSHKVLTIVAFLGAAAAGAAITALQVQPNVPQGIEIGGRTPAELFNYFVALVGGGGGLAALLKVLWPQGATVIDSLKQRIDSGKPVTPEYGVTIGALLALKKTYAGVAEAAGPLETLWALAFKVDEEK